MEKIGTVTISVFRSEYDINSKSDNPESIRTTFDIQVDSDDVLPVSYVIEDTLKFY